MSKTKQIIEIAIGLIFLFIIIAILVSVWPDRTPWSSPEDETPVYSEQSIF